MEEKIGKYIFIFLMGFILGPPILSNLLRLLDNVAIEETSLVQDNE
jgi:hypothetical protein